MSINALNTATAGLKVTQAAIGIVSQNVANAGSDGYVRRRLSTVSTDGNAGVTTGTVTRIFDETAQRQLRLETSGAAYTGLVATTQASLSALYGTPGSASALDGVLNTFTQSLQTLAGDPSSTGARATVLAGARSLAGALATISDGVQTLRSSAESQLDTDVAAASNLLSRIAGLNTKIIGLNGSDRSAASGAELADQRDQALGELSRYMDLQTSLQADGSVTVTTGSGITLVDHGAAASLGFDGRGRLDPGATYTDDPATRGVGTIVAVMPSGARIDLVATGTVRSGSIAAGLALRDDTLVQAQRQLDDFAAGLSRALSDRAVAGTPASEGAASGFDIDLTGLQAGNAVTLATRGASGAAHTIVLVPTTGNAAGVSAAQTNDPTATVLTVDISGGPATTAARIGAALGDGYRVSATTGGGVRILATGATALTGIDASITVPTRAGDVRTAGTQLAVFVDSGYGDTVYTGSFEGGSHLTGLAQRLVLNPALAADSAGLIVTAAGTLPGDGTRPKALLDALTGAARTFSAASGLGGVSAPYTTSVQGFAQGIIDFQGAAAEQAGQLDQGQSIAFSTARSRFSADSGVSIDEEMANLIQLQTAYSANARVLTAARDMLDTLLRI
ncbi:flagellar hook-associated protein FlgK [uncultured Methylobacterium sp.]|jgi:flagellar hook-associated protein 1 FlgK|uniref:flagellar hook-associated protein FlgK n=1 Tax=uncultured Methylobacterium sp. TaxID=157278 RepID=UPI002626433A|nr:flagellar hook-associated protein FlgK [uncultured Methylobacterium sp.]